MKHLVFIPLLAACHSAPRFPADVKLAIDGTSHDYSTGKVEWEREGSDGPFSVYLLPDDKQSGQPYVNLRYDSGNPVGHFWLRYATDPTGFAEPPKWECFVPGQLRDGTNTLTWKNDDGTDRHTTETGEPDCKATVTDDGGGRLHVSFDAVVRPKDKKPKGEDGADNSLRVQGSADIRAAPVAD